MSQLRAIQQKQDELLSVVDSMSHATTLGSHSPTMTGLRPSPVPGTLSSIAATKRLHDLEDAGDSAAALESKATATPPLRAADASPSQAGASSPTQSGVFTSRIILTWVHFTL